MLKRNMKVVKQSCQDRRLLCTWCSRFTDLHCKGLSPTITLFTQRICKWFVRDWQQSMRSWNWESSTNRQLTDQLTKVQLWNVRCLYFHWELFLRTQTQTCWNQCKEHISMVKFLSIWSLFTHDNYCHIRRDRLCLSHHIVITVLLRFHRHKEGHIFFMVQHQ